MTFQNRVLLGGLILFFLLGLVSYYTIEENCYIIVDDGREILKEEDRGCKKITVEQFKTQTERF